MSLLNKALLAASLAMVAIPVANALTISINDTTDPIPPPASEPSFEVSTVPPGIVGVFTAADLLIVVRDPGTTDVSDIISCW